MPYPAIAIANQFLELAKRDGISLSPMKIQKLVYFAHGWHLAITGRPLIKERIEAWKFGPVIDPLYQAFKQYGSDDITKPVTVTKIENGEFVVYAPSLNAYPESDELRMAKQVIERVWDVYKNFSAVRLSNATHTQGTPWAQIYREGSFGDTIPDEIIRTYFQKLAHDRAAV